MSPRYLAARSSVREVNQTGRQRMNESVWYDRTRRAIVIDVPERVDSVVLDELRERMRALPGFTPDTPVYVDWTRITPSDLTAGLVRERAWRPWPVTARIAFHAPSDVLFGLARMYALQSSQRIEVFRERDEAFAWLAEETHPGRAGEPSPHP